MRMEPDWLIDFLERVEIVQKQADLSNALKALAGNLGFDHFGYVDSYGSDIRGLSNYPKDWQKIYIARQLVVLDPVVKSAQAIRRPFNWDQSTLPLPMSQRQAAFMEEAAQGGIAAGVTIPIPAGYRHSVMLTLASPFGGTDKLDDRQLSFLRDAAISLHGHIRGRLRHLLDGPDYRLTPGECRVLNWARHGFPANEIAPILGVKYDSVQFHLRSIRRKLGAMNIQHAVGIATSHGLI